MKFRQHIKLEHGLKQIDIAPLIDVVFLLIIFFLLTSSFIVLPGVKVKLPQAATSEDLNTQDVIITITAEELVYLNQEPVTTEELKKRLINLDPQGYVFIRSDRQTSLGRVVQVWDICRQLDIKQVNIATTQGD